MYHDDAPWPEEPSWPADPWGATQPAPRSDSWTAPREGTPHPPPQRWSPLPQDDGQPNGWERPPAPPRVPNSGYSPLPSNTATPQWDTPTLFMAPTAPSARAERRAPPPKRRVGWSLPVEHLVLAAGFVGMLLALTQPWGNDSHGHIIYLGPTASRVAYDVLGGLAVLGGLRCAGGIGGAGWPTMCWGDWRCWVACWCC